MRYMVLSYVITLQRISLRVKKRFPGWQHLVDAGLMLESERKIFEIMDQKSPMSKYWMPLVWATNILNRARRDGLITSDHLVQTLLMELSDIRRRLGALIGYDTVCVPLVYTQVSWKLLAGNFNGNFWNLSLPTGRNASLIFVLHSSFNGQTDGPIDNRKQHREVWSWFVFPIFHSVTSKWNTNLANSVSCLHLNTFLNIINCLFFVNNLCEKKYQKLNNAKIFETEKIRSDKSCNSNLRNLRDANAVEILDFFALSKDKSFSCFIALGYISSWIFVNCISDRSKVRQIQWKSISNYAERGSNSRSSPTPFKIHPRKTKIGNASATPMINT